VRFVAEHHFGAPPEAVAAVLADPQFYRTLELPDLSLLEVDGSHGGSPDDASVRLRYEFSGDLDAIAKRLLGGARLVWTQEVRLDGSTGGSISFSADANPRLLHGEAAFTLEPADGGGDGDDGHGPGERSDSGQGTIRRVTGELTVAIPGIGGMAERRIVPGIVRRLDVEAEAVRRSLS
jgi:hypothetical protein